MLRFTFTKSFCEHKGQNWRICELQGLQGQKTVNYRKFEAHRRWSKFGESTKSSCGQNLQWIQRTPIWRTWKPPNWQGFREVKAEKSTVCEVFSWKNSKLLSKDLERSRTSVLVKSANSRKESSFLTKDLRDVNSESVFTEKKGQRIRTTISRVPEREVSFHVKLRKSSKTWSRGRTHDFTKKSEARRAVPRFGGPRRTLRFTKK